MAQIDELQKLYRDNVRLASEEFKLLREEPADIIKNLSILRALRAASEFEPVRAAPTVKARGKQSKVGPKIEAFEGSVDSPIASPAISVGAPAARLKGSSGRSGSVASVRETREKAESKEKEVKIEDGEGGKGATAERAGKFFRGAEVAYKQAKMKEDGSQWIQCLIMNITESGNKKRLVS